MTKLTAALSALLTLLLITNTAAAQNSSQDSAQGIAPIAKQHRFPDIRWQDGDGQEHNLYHYTEKPKILHFWAAWCTPCKKEMPHLIDWTHANPDFQVLQLSLDDRIAQTQHFIKKYKLDMPALLLNKDDADELEVPVLPYTIIVDADSYYLHHFSGSAPWHNDDLTKAIKKLVE